MNGESSSSSDSNVGAVAGAANQNTNNSISGTAEGGNVGAVTGAATASQNTNTNASSNSGIVGGGNQKLEQLIEPIEKVIVGTQKNIEQLEEIKSALD